MIQERNGYRKQNCKYNKDYARKSKKFLLMLVKVHYFETVENNNPTLQAFLSLSLPI